MGGKMIGLGYGRGGTALLALALLGLALLASGCVELDAALASPTPIASATPQATPTRDIPSGNTLPTGGATPTVEVDIFKLLPPDYQPLAVQRVDLDGDGSQEWVVLAGKSGQPTFETVVPLALGVFGGVARELWRGQPDFAVSTAGDLKVVDITGDGRPEIIYQNHTPLGGSYAFVYAGSNAVTSHDAMPPVGGPLDGVGFFSGWQLDFLPPDAAGHVAISSVTDLAGTRWIYRWDGSALHAAEELHGTPFPTVQALRTPVPANPETYDVTGDLTGATVEDKIVADLDGDGADEIAVLYRVGDLARLQIAIFAYSAPPGFTPAFRNVWSSGVLLGIENQVFKLRDLTADGKPELLSGQGAGDAGNGTLYVVGKQNGAYGFIKPSGGHFDGKESIGAGDYIVQEQGGGKPPFVLGQYDDGAHSDVYQWDNGVFKFLHTQ